MFIVSLCCHFVYSIRVIFLSVVFGFYNWFMRRRQRVKKIHGLVVFLGVFCVVGVWKGSQKCLERKSVV